MARTLGWYRNLCDSDFFSFVKICGGAVGQGGVISPVIHRPLCNRFQDFTQKRQAFFLPRNWLKSTVWTCWGSIWHYCKNPDIQILIASENERNAKRFQLFIERQILYNPMLRKLYPDRFSMIDQAYKRRHRWTSEEMYLPRAAGMAGGGKEATITSIGIKGAAQSGHYDILMIDDPVGKKHQDSVTELENVLSWHDNTDELLDNANWKMPEASVIHINCTFWGPADYGSYVMLNFPEYQFYVVPALKYPDVKDTPNLHWIQDPNASKMETNWPDAPKGRSKTEYYVDMMSKPMKQQIFWSQHMNMPQKATGLQKFDLDWLKEWQWLERLVDDNRKEQYIICMDDDEEFLYNKIPKWGMIDPGGFAETRMVKSGSRLAMVIGGQPTSTTKKFIFYAWAGKMKDPKYFMDELFEAHERYRPLYWKIENIGSQDYIYKDIKQEAKERGIPLRIMTLPVSPRKGDKDIDIAALIKPFANGEYYFHNSQTEAKAEIQNYPQGLTKDIIDMIAKLQKYQFKRTPAEDIRDLMKMRKREFIEGMRDTVNEVTGY